MIGIAARNPHPRQTSKAFSGWWHRLRPGAKKRQRNGWPGEGSTSRNRRHRKLPATSFAQKNSDFRAVSVFARNLVTSFETSFSCYFFGNSVVLKKKSHLSFFCCARTQFFLKKKTFFFFVFTHGSFCGCPNFPCFPFKDSSVFRRRGRVVCLRQSRFARGCLFFHGSSCRFFISSSDIRRVFRFFFLHFTPKFYTSSSRKTLRLFFCNTFAWTRRPPRPFRITKTGKCEKFWDSSGN